MTNNPQTSILSVLARIYWLMVGPLVLAALAILVVKTGNGWLTGADFGYLAVLAALALARLLEFQCGNPQRADGEPATSQDLRRYVIGVAVIGLSVWVVGNILGNYML